VWIHPIKLSKGCGHTHFLAQPRHSGKITVMHKNVPTRTFLIFQCNTLCAIFFTWAKTGGGLKRPSGSQLHKTPRHPLFGVLYVGESICLLRRMSEETRHPYMFTYVINAVVALAGDDSSGQQCTEMMSYVFVSQASTYWLQHGEERQAIRQ